MKQAPLFASETTAARLLDMKPAEFRDLVKNRHLPQPRDIAGMKRWDVAELQTIISGGAVEGLGDVKW